MWRAEKDWAAKPFWILWHRLAWGRVRGIEGELLEN